MSKSQLRFAFLFATGIALSMSSAIPARAYTEDQQQLCSGDAFRLCSSAIPDVDRVTACMIQRRAQLSPGCAQFFHEPEADPAMKRERVRKPLAIAPRKAKKPRKSS
jgi:hypothetical protein